MHRLLTAVIAIGSVALLFASAGAADTSQSLPYSNLALNECNGEEVVVQGVIHTNETVDLSGHSHVTVNLSDVKGVALVTGARYVESDTTAGTSNFTFDGASEFNVVETRVLNRLGEDGTHLDDVLYHLTAHMTVNSNGVVTVDRTDSSIECR
jgi:hypothetical protein